MPLRSVPLWYCESVGELDSGTSGAPKDVASGLRRARKGDTLNGEVPGIPHRRKHSQESRCPASPDSIFKGANHVACASPQRDENRRLRMPLRSVPLWYCESVGELDSGTSGAPKDVASGLRRARKGDTLNGEVPGIPHRRKHSQESRCPASPDSIFKGANHVACASPQRDENRRLRMPLRSVPLWYCESVGELDSGTSGAPKDVASGLRRARKGDTLNGEVPGIPHRRKHSQEKQRCK